MELSSSPQNRRDNYVGAETGRDGLAGAAFASRELTEESKEDRPAVQVGDPFREKLLLEACLKLLASGCVAGIQNMGAAGLTPTVGIVEDAAHITTQFFKSAGDSIILVGEPGDELGASHYLLAVHGVKAGPPPKLDYEKELAVQDAVRSLIRMGLVKSAHDCAEGGLAVTLAESCISGDKMLGAAVEIPSASSRADIPLFNESQSRIIVSVKSGDADDVLAQHEKRGVTPGCRRRAMHRESEDPADARIIARPSRPRRSFRDISWGFSRTSPGNLRSRAALQFPGI